MSTAMLDFIVDENHIDALSRTDITRVQVSLVGVQCVLGEARGCTA